MDAGKSDMFVSRETAESCVLLKVKRNRRKFNFDIGSENLELKKKAEYLLSNSVMVKQKASHPEWLHYGTI